jgi:hypothetical protein
MDNAQQWWRKRFKKPETEAAQDEREPVMAD